ncbi:MAG: amino acid ABC transporter substrate-binding protein [Gammaproteobacteria bacterium]|nr:MAG: amino acid ABC transporter substrate-binding protein [Gammaproteobacteria bacterium]
MLAAGGEPSKPNHVRIATGDWLPYVGKSLRHDGALAELITLAFGRAGYEVEFGYFPWSRGYELVRSGGWDATMPYYCSPERQKLFYCSEALVEGEQVFFHLKGQAPDWQTLDDLKGVPIGATLGYYYGEAFEAREKDGTLRVRRIASDETNMRLLFMGRIKLFPQDKMVGYSLARKLYPNRMHELTHDPRPLHTQSLHLIFPKNRARGRQLLEVFDREFRALRADGTVARYLQALQDGEYEQPAPSGNAPGQAE